MEKETTSSGGPSRHSSHSDKGRDEDANLVRFDGDDDPKNWSFSQKWITTGTMSLITFMTPITSSMIAPAAAQIAADIHVPTTFDSNLIFSVFLLGFVLGPFFAAPLSELYGRLIVLQLANLWFLAFTLGNGFAQTTGEMIALRFLSGLGACVPQTVGGGVLSDVWRPHERGLGLAVYSLAPLLGPTLGPILGAWVVERSTWRWCFWAVTIFGVFVQALVFFLVSETSPSYLLTRKAKKLREATGNQALHSAYETEDRRLTRVLMRSFSRVFILLGTQPIVQFLALYMALLYGLIYLMLSTFPSVWTGIYQESVGIGGLNYISLLIGLSSGALASGKTLDIIYKRLSQRSPNKEGRPEFRVPLLFLSTFLVATGLLIFGWTAQELIHWIVPNIGAMIFGLGVPMSFTALQGFTIDCYGAYAASAVGATAVARSLTGFGFPLFGDALFSKLGEGWGNSILALATLVIGYGGSLTLWFFGPRLRAASRYATDK